MIRRPAVIPRFSGVARSLPTMRSSFLEHPPRSRATRSPVIIALMGNGYGNDGAMETTKRFPQRLGNLAQHARFPHSHSRSFSVSQEAEDEEEGNDMPYARQLDTRPRVKAR
jgi:hypothetical protein